MPKKKKIRKTERCLNCDESLTQAHNFCPNCGQRNQDNYVSVSQLLRDFFSNYFSLDSRFGHTFKPFFLKPGKVTEEFIKGRRVHFANPIRLYLVISLLHFFFLSLVTEIGNEQEQGTMIKITKDRDYQKDGNSDSVQIALARKEAKIDSAFTFPFDPVVRLHQTTDLTEQQIFDTLAVDRGNFWQRTVTRKFIRIKKSSNRAVSSYVLGNLPIVAFLLLPIYALLLKLFFWRRGLYIKHLVHSLHLHSFALTIFTLLWILELSFSLDVEWLMPWMLVLIFIYIIFSCRRLYQQGYVKIFFKMSALGFFYLIFTALFLVFGAGISLLFF